MPRVLITGASIAGNTAAWWLSRNGFEVTVVEKAPDFRDGGQNLDVRGPGREVLRRMGLEQAALKRGTGEEGTCWVDAEGHPVAQFGVGDDGPTAELEILRGDLARLIYEGAREHAAFRWGDSLERVDEGRVTFASGATAEYDAILVAEGVGSTTRELVFPGENDPRYMDLTIAYCTIPRVPGDDKMWRWYHAPEGRGVSLRPDSHGTTRAMLSIQGPTTGEQDWPEARQKAWLRERFADAGWQAPRVLAALEETEDFYFDVLRQVRLPRWSSGKVVLTGDAAWCVTPLAGVGATLALVGAYVLAGEMVGGGGFAAYEAAVRPMVDDVQGVPRIGPRLMNPHSRLGIKLLHLALRLASKLPTPGLAREIKSPDLSRYREILRG